MPKAFDNPIDNKLSKKIYSDDYFMAEVILMPH